MRNIFSSKGGSLAEGGSVSWMFAKMGVVHALGSTTEDELLEKLIDYDIKDISVDNDSATITCDPKSLEKVKQIIADSGLKVETAELEWVAQNNADLPEDQAQKALDFLSNLEDHDDVQNVYTNLGSEG